MTRLICRGISHLCKNLGITTWFATRPDRDDDAVGFRTFSTSRRPRRT